MCTFFQPRGQTPRLKKCALGGSNEVSAADTLCSFVGKNLEVSSYNATFAKSLACLAMNEDKKKYEEMDFEDITFVSECLESFDESVAKIEAEYEVTSKSA